LGERERENACRLLVGEPQGKRPLGRAKLRWEYNIKMDLGEVGWGGVDWIDLARDRDQYSGFVNRVMNLLVPYSVGKFFSGCTIGGLSRRSQLRGVSRQATSWTRDVGFLRSVRTNCAHPTSYGMGTESSFLGGVAGAIS
jgi:hypothetical protein